LTVEALPVMCSNNDLWNIVTEDSEDEGHTCWHCSSCFQPYKDLVIPGFVSQWSMERILASARDLKDRTYLACYHGSDSGMRRMYRYGNATARNHLQELRGAPWTSIGNSFNIASDYFDRIGQCMFCFVPKGLGYWSNRLFEVMFAGCIPVILSDEIGLPFEDVIEWPQMSVKWPMNDVGYPLLQHLASLASDRLELVKTMHENILKHRCWFDYHRLGDSTCSPYVAILKALLQRREAFPTSFGQRWPSAEVVARRVAEWRIAAGEQVEAGHSNQAAEERTSLHGTTSDR